MYVCILSEFATLFDQGVVGTTVAYVVGNADNEIEMKVIRHPRRRRRYSQRGPLCRS